jgi:hypothetical protein
MAAWRSRADSALGWPMRSRVWAIWRCRLVRSTTCRGPPGDAAHAGADPRYSATGEPSPPAPITSAWAARMRSWPSMPISSSRMCREYRSSWSSFRALCAVFLLLFLALDLGLADQHRAALELVQRLGSWKSFSEPNSGNGARPAACGFFFQLLAGFLAGLSRGRRPSFPRPGRCSGACPGRPRGCAAPRTGCPLRFVHHHVGHDALGLDGAAAGRVVARGRELEAGVRAQGRTVCTEPLPKVWLPMMVARLWSCSAPATISLAEAEPSLTSTTSGTFLRPQGPLQRVGSPPRRW